MDLIGTAGPRHQSFPTRTIRAGEARIPSPQKTGNGADEVYQGFSRW